MILVEVGLVVVIVACIVGMVRYVRRIDRVIAEARRHTDRIRRDNDRTEELPRQLQKE